MSTTIPKVYFGSILDCHNVAAVVVNPANSFLRHGGGLARVLDQVAQTLPGYDHIQKCSPESPQSAIKAVGEYQAWHALGHRVATGDAILGPPGLLPFAAIIHAVGPIWKDGSVYEAELLHEAYYNASAVARDAGYTSIVFPAIGAGIFGCPIDVVAAEAVHASYAFRDILVTTYAVTDPEHEAAFNKEIQEIYFD